MKKILIYSGTTEGRSLSELLSRHGIACDVCVATAYGEQVMQPSDLVRILVGRRNAEEMAQLWKEQDYLCVVDATHPYAFEVSRNIRSSLEGGGLPYLRLERHTETERSAQLAGNCEYYASAQECALALEKRCQEDPDHTRVLLTTGSRQLPLFCKSESLRPYLVARILPDPDSLRICYENGLEGKQIIAMQGPFTEEVNRALIRQYRITMLVTKESGRVGGSDAKLSAAAKEGIVCCVIRRQEDPGMTGAAAAACSSAPRTAAFQTAPSLTAGAKAAEEAQRFIQSDYEGIVAELERLTGVKLHELTARSAAFDASSIEDGAAKAQRAEDSSAEAGSAEASSAEASIAETCQERGHAQVILAGCGMGGEDAMTGQVSKAVEQADLLFGAERLLRPFKDKQTYPYYKAEEILPVLEKALAEKRQKRECAPLRCVVLFSGDTGFYSGCLKLLAKLQERPWVETEVLPGISSICALAAKCRTPWQDGVIISTHGIERSIWEARLIRSVKGGKKVFFLSSGAADIQLIGQLLTRNGLDDTKIRLGYQMSYPEEKLLQLTPEECLQVTEKGLYTGLLTREGAKPQRLIAAFADEDMMRTTVPMTKEEIRELSVCKLHLTENACVYDIGCGTGSVSMEIAALCPGIRVFAIDDNPEAVDLTRRNAQNLALPNIEVVQGRAPEALEDLPAATHAFLGGTKGNLDQILQLLYRKNPHMRIVMNAVTMESAGQMSRIRKMVPLGQEEIIQVQVSRARLAGPYHLMQAGNPVFIGSFTFREEQEQADISS